MRTLLIALVLILSACQNETPKQTIVYTNCSSVAGGWVDDRQNPMVDEKVYVIHNDCSFGSMTKNATDSVTDFSTGKIELQKDLFIAHGDLDEDGYQSRSETCTYKVVTPKDEMVINCGFGDTTMFYRELDADGNLAYGEE